MVSKPSFWSLHLDSSGDAKNMIRESAMGFYAVAGIQAVVSLLLGMSMLLDAIIFASLAYWLQRSQSRVPATLLLGVAAIGVATTAMNQFGGGAGGRNIVLSLIVLWAAVRAVVATFKLPHLLPATPPAPVGG